MKNPLLRCIFLFAKWQNPVPCNSCSAEGITAQLKTDQVWTGAVLPGESVLHVQALWWVLTAQQLYSIFFCMNNRVILEVELTWLLSLQIKIWLLPSCMWAEKTFSCSWVNSKDQSSFFHADYMCCMLWVHEMAVKGGGITKLRHYKVKINNFTSINRVKKLIYFRVI